VLSYYDEIEQAPPITRDEVEEFVKEMEKTVFDLFEGANEVFEITPCGQFRMNEQELKDIDILITRKDEGPTRYVLLKLIE
jgi:SAM-dependent MidA family methyltransferase